MPSLRERPEDVVDIAAAILKRMGGAHVCSATRKRRSRPTPFPAMCANWRTSWSARWRWPTTGTQSRRSQPGPGCQPGQSKRDRLGQRYPLQDYLDRLEKLAIEQALEKTRYNKTAAARLLGVTFRSLRYRLQRLGIE